MNTWQIVLCVVIGIIALAGLITGMVYAIMALVQRIDGSKRGWRRLAAVYATVDPPAGSIVTRETLKIGAVVYKRCVTVGIADEGLYVSIWRKTLLIPWNHFTKIEQATLHWNKVPMLTVGETTSVATITVPMSVFGLPWRNGGPRRVVAMLSHFMPTHRSVDQALSQNG